MQAQTACKSERKEIQNLCTYPPRIEYAQSKEKNTEVVHIS